MADDTERRTSETFDFYRNNALAMGILAFIEEKQVAGVSDLLDARRSGYFPEKVTNKAIRNMVQELLDFHLLASTVTTRRLKIGVSYYARD